MMSSSGYLPFVVLWCLHFLSVLAFFTGLLFFIILAAKTFHAKQLKLWALWLMIVGTVVCLLTVATMGGSWAGHGKKMMHGTMMDRGTMQNMMDMLDGQKDSMSKTQYDDMKKFMEEMVDEAGDREGVPMKQ